eukprot:CAMPEP_0198586562 /NCGR_PEP_ID=MMETSP1462-20131121/130768_1 /TAXON_ID=1333877 /ORGANISM="Brandtodinium nutriculum, Strain RCC3387" /LENGTH=44 /DNA_ID= /DNA_START= /DNA_END= /DNA_ORIENTATION=
MGLAPVHHALMQVEFALNRLQPRAAPEPAPNEKEHLVGPACGNV